MENKFFKIEVYKRNQVAYKKYSKKSKNIFKR